MNSRIDSVSYNKKIENEVRNLIYTPLKTIKECNNWAEQSLKIEHVNYKRFHIDIANKINRQLQIMFHLYPEVNTIRCVSDIRSCVLDYFMNSNVINTLITYIDNDIEEMIIKNFENFVAVAINENSEFKGIWFNNYVLSDYNKLVEQYKRNVKSGFSPIGTNKIEATVTHEFAHHLEYFLVDENLFGYMHKIWRQNHVKIKSKKKRNIKSCKNIKKKLSLYASQNISEFFAEAMAEYIHNPKPRPLAMEIGQKTDEVFRNLRQKNNV